MNPFLIAALLSGAGSLYNWNIQNQAINAQNRENQKAMDMERAARDAERTRQRAYESTQAEAAARALMEADPAASAEAVTEVTDTPDNEFVRSAEDYNIPALQGQETDGPVATEIGRIVADALQRTKGILKAQSILSAQGTEMGGTNDALARMAADIANTGSARRGSLAVSNLETSVPAATVTPSSSPLGDLLMLGGMVYGAKGGNLFGNKPLAVPGMAFGTRAAPGAVFGGAPSSGLPAIY